VNKSLRILYIEDEETLAQLVKRRLARKGFQVELALDGEAGLVLLSTGQFDVVIVDYQLPKMNGLDVLQQIADQNITTSAIMVSGVDDIRVVVKAMNLGCMDYLVKDGNSYLELLPVHIEAVIARRDLQLEKEKAEQDNIEAQESLARAQGLAHIGNWEWHAGDKTAWWSDEEYCIFGLTKKDGEVTGVSYLDYKNLIYQEDLSFVEYMNTKLTEGQSLDFDYRIQLPDGGIRWVQARNNAEYDTEGKIIRHFGTTQDITDRKQSEKQLLLAQQVFDTTTEAIMVADADENIISVNPAFTKITGYEKEEVIGKAPRLLQSGKHNDLFYKQMWHDLIQDGHWSGEIWNRKKSGELYPEWLSIAVIYDRKGNVEQYVSIFSDITQHKEAEQLIEYQANYDALTGLPNRNLFNDRLSTSLKVAQRENSCLALLFLDLDRFKWINDTLGHRAGDILLKETATRLTSVLRQSDSVSRLGGDEFTVILTDLDNELDSELIAEKILAQLALPFNLDEQEVYVTGSIGITVFPSDGDTAERLYQNADNAMYAAKEAGRNQFSFFTAEMQKQAETRLILLNELRQAIENKEFELYYQAVIDIKDNSLSSAEALIRWNHPQRGIVGPFDFIPLAEETGLIQPLGAWVVEQALQQLKQWNDAGHRMHIAVNKSSKQFHNDECAIDLYGRMQELGIDSSQLTVEITETVLMEEQESTLQLLQDYRQAGISVSLDDFGTGYSSLSYLRKFPFDVIKIDRSFVMDVTENEDDSSLVEAIILMGHKLGLRVVAEGVETRQQRDFLKDKNCDLLQGYFYSRPIPAKEFEQRFIINQEWKQHD